MRSFRLDPDKVVLGSVLRRALPYLLTEGALYYDQHRPAAMNDLVFGEIIETPSLPFAELKYNVLERLYADAGRVKLKNETVQPGPCIAVVGNRYAPPYLIGGLTNPITGRPNGEVHGGVVAEGLFGVNVVGYVNCAAVPEEPVRIKIHGVLVDSSGRSVNLSRFQETLLDFSEPSAREPFLIVVTGYATDAGKTTCAWALVSELRKRGFRVTVEKKTGTASCRDWLRCYSDPETGLLENAGDEACFVPDCFPARDFVDALGVASDVSIGTEAFVSGSVRYTRAFLSRNRPDFHVIELADSISHVSNTRLLQSDYFRQQIKALVYSSLPSHEAAAHFLTFWRALGYSRVQPLLSGPLANEDQHNMAREEIRERLGLRVCRSAVRKNGRWTPDGTELTNAVLEGSA